MPRTTDAIRRVVAALTYASEDVVNDLLDAEAERDRYREALEQIAADHEADCRSITRPGRLCNCNLEIARKALEHSTPPCVASHCASPTSCTRTDDGHGPLTPPETPNAE